jgi:hypothetical protein
MSPDVVLSPCCPRCGQPPVLMVSVAQVFCGTEGCAVFCWDMRDPPETFEREAVVIEISLTEQRND